MAIDFFSIDGSKRSRLVSLVMFWVSAYRLNISRTARGTDEISMIRGVGKVTYIADMRALHERMRDRIVADRCVRARCRYQTEPSVGKLENRLIEPLASNQAKVSQHRSRDRLLNNNECEAA